MSAEAAEVMELIDLGLRKVARSWGTGSGATDLEAVELARKALDGWQLNYAELPQIVEAVGDVAWRLYFPRACEEWLRGA